MRLPEVRLLPEYGLRKCQLLSRHGAVAYARVGRGCSGGKGWDGNAGAAKPPSRHRSAMAPRVKPGPFASGLAAMATTLNAVNLPAMMGTPR